MDEDIQESALDPTEGQKLTRLLWEDVAPSGVFPDVAASPRERRQFIRSMFACVDGTIWIFKQEALHQHERGAVSFTHLELALLAEQLPALDAEGNLHETPANIRFAPNIRFTFRCHAQSYRYENALDVSDHRWDVLRRSAQVRNRLMHPKGLGSMQVSDDEFLAARTSLAWFARTVSLAHLGASTWHAVRGAAETDDPQRASAAELVIRAKMDELRSAILAKT